MAKTGFDEVFEQMAAGLDYRAHPGGDGTWRLRIEGDPFPRILFKIKEPDILTGNGQIPPTSIIGGVGPGGNGLPVFDVVNAYSAAVDGVTDAAAPINQAIADCAAAGGGIVWCDAAGGSFAVVSTDITLVSGVQVWCAPGTTFIDDRASGSTFRIRGVSALAPIERCLVRDATITGTNAGTNARKAIEVKWASRCAVAFNTITGSGHGVWVYSALACQIVENHFTECSSSDGSGKAAVTVIDDASGHSESVKIDGNLFDDCFEHDILIVGGGGNRPDAILVANNRIVAAKIRGNRISLTTTRGCRVRDNFLTATGFDGGYSTVVSGIYVKDALGCLVYANTFNVTDTVFSACIEVDARTIATTSVNVTGNQFHATSAMATAFVYWRHTAPFYNMVGCDRDNVAVLNVASSALRSGMPDTFSETMIHGPLIAKEHGVIADGVAFDGAAMQALAARSNTENRDVKLPSAATIRCAISAGVPALLEMDRRDGVGDVIWDGDGQGNSIIDFDADLGLDDEGVPNVGFNALNCEQNGSVGLYNVTFLGNQSQSGAAMNPNATVVPDEKGSGVRIPNRCDYRGVTANGFKYGFIQDGIAVQTYAATVTNNNATIVVARALDSAWVGANVYGSTLPSGATITSIAPGGLSFTVNNAHKPIGNDTAVRIAVPQNTDHFETDHCNANGNRIGIYLTRTGADAGGTLDFFFNDWTIGQCQWAGVAVSPTGAMHDAALVKFHVANCPYSFIKEGNYGEAADNNIFFQNVSMLSVKSEGAGNAHLYDFTGLARFLGVSGEFEFHGIEINGQKTHKAVVNNHTYQPWSGNAVRTAGEMTVSSVTAGIIERAYTATITHGSAAVSAFSPAISSAEVGLPIEGGCIKPGTTIASVNVGANTAVLSTAAGSAGAQGAATPLVLGHGINVGDHIGVRSSADVTYVDSAIITEIVSATSFKAKLGAQSKTVVTNGWSTSDTTTDVTGSVNVKTQDIGCLITGSGGALDAATTVDDAAFKTQVITFSIPATGNAPNGQTLTLVLADSATPRAIQFGELVAFRLGETSDLENIKFDVQVDPTTENIGTSLWWSFYSVQDCDICVTPTESGGMPVVEVISGIGAHANTRIRKGATVCELREAKGTFKRGDRLVASGTNGVKAASAGVNGVHEGFCRGADGGVATAVNADLSTIRPIVLVQKSGPNYATSFRSEGGGGRTQPSAVIAAGKYLVKETVGGSPEVKLKQWDETTAGLLVVAKSIGVPVERPAGSGEWRIDIEVLPGFIT